MKAPAPDAPGAGGLVTAFATSDAVSGPPGDIAPDRDSAGAGDSFRDADRDIDAALARLERTIAGVVQGLRDRLARRRAVRELRRLGRSRLADIGIEPEEIERVVDAMIAARRSRAATRGRSPRPRSV